MRAAALIISLILAPAARAGVRDPDVLVLVQLASATARVRAHEVRLADIATVDVVAGSETRRRTAAILAKNAVVARFGTAASLRIEAAAIREALVRSGFADEGIDLQGPAAVTVSRRMMTLSAGRIRAAVRRHVRDVLGRIAESADVRIVGTVAPAEIPVARWRLRLAVASAEKGTRWLGRVPVNVGVEVDGRTVTTVAVTVVVDRPVHIVRAVKRITRGRAISADDVDLVDADAASVTPHHLTSLDEVIGLIAVDGFTRGQALTRRELRPRPVIRKGDVITARACVGAMVIEVTCIARMDGAPGDRIVLTNMETKKAIRGVVVNAKNVDVRIDSGERRLP